jgi:predicted nucleotidyltransferase
MSSTVSPQPPWLVSTALVVPPLGPGLDPAPIAARLWELSRHPDVKALVLFGSRARGQASPRSDLDLMLVTDQKLPPEQERALWRHARALLRPTLPVDLDLLIVAGADAEEFKTSRWHVVGHAFREGKVLYAA